MRPPVRRGDEGFPRILTLCVAVFMACSVVSGQDVSPERVKVLEDALRTERDRNDAQGRRIEELELTLASVISSQVAQSNQSAISTEIERLVTSTVDRKLQATRGRDRLGKVTVNGQTRFSLRFFGGAEISTDSSFEIEHLIIEITAKVSDEFQVRLSPGTSHTGALYMLEAYGDYTVDPALEIMGGRFLIPFNGIHSWAFPSDSFIEPYLGENAPKPFFYTPYWDEGILVKGEVPFGCERQHKLWYAAYVINGPDALSLDGIHKRTFGDNNENKALGGRVSATFRLGRETTLAVAAAGIAGKYDVFDELAYYAIEADVELATGPFTFYAEAFHRPTEIRGDVIENPAASLIEVARLTGVKFRPEVRLLPNLRLFAQLDYLVVQQPPRMGGDFSIVDLEDESFAIRTGTLGLKFDVAPHVRLILEGGIFDRDDDLGPDITYIGFSTFYYF
jgi:hypothetical protein